jgi:outer membrane lipoprotein SlyB
MPKYQIYFDTQDGEIHRTVTIDENEVLDALLGDILAEFEERDGYVLRGWREGLGNPTCRWEGKELESSMTLPEQGVRPNDVIRVSIKRPSLELNRDGELYEITERTELRTGDEILLGRTMLRFNIKDQQRRIDQSKTFIQRVQQGRSFQQTIWEMALIGALAGVICWFIWSLLQIPLAIDVEYYDMIAFTLLGALIGGLSVGVNDRRLGDAIVPLWILIGVVCGAVAGAAGGWIARFIRSAMIDASFTADVLSWLIAGALIGFGISFRWWRVNRSRVFNGLLGGMAGGVVGGLAYLLLANLIGGGNSQAIGMALAGLGITTFISLAPILTRQGVLEFVNSSDASTQKRYKQSRKQWDIHNGEKYVIGRLSASQSTTMLSPELQIYVPDSLVEPRHAILISRDRRFYIEPHPSITLTAGKGGRA